MTISRRFRKSAAGLMASPLALELAAAHVGIFGVRDLATRLGDRLALLNRGRRTAAPRHRTLRATLDWSHDLLPEPEQVILRRLSVFQDDCTMQSIVDVVANGTLRPDQVIGGIASLVDKSLLAVDITHDAARYHLWESTHACALDKLRRSGEYDHIRERHARYFHRLIANAESAAADELPLSRLHLADNYRAALDWSFSPSGDAALGIRLGKPAIRRTGTGRDPLAARTGRA
jgi:predicted ATPase